MASQIQALKDQENLVRRTLDTVMECASTQRPFMYILDTGGFIDLYKYHPALIPNSMIHAECVTTQAVFNELHLRKNHKIINQVYQLEANRDFFTPHIEIVGVTPTQRCIDMFRYGLKKGSFNGNRRLGEADMSILALADEMKEHIYPVIVSPDSDIPRVLNGIRTQMIGYLPAPQFINLYAALYEKTPRSGF
ncbi:MAG TPA: hypothetical protein VK158_02840 [Acidobacteriota bacterium]|nr:hypothetical protein [Acidobacteriota bacterium]